MLEFVSRRPTLGAACSRAALLAAMAGLALPALAQTVPASTTTAPVNLDLGSVLATGAFNQVTNYQNTPGSAPYEAPSVAPLNAKQPTSLITRHTIENNFTSTQSYADFAKLSPSVSSVEPNGPGLMENVGLSIRGFQDGQFNVTWDGIPIGDSNDFTHHTTSFFAANDIGQTIVDRGPGTAETVGDATFGGTISIRTKDPLTQRTFTPYGEYGSYSTSVGGAEYDTGAIQSANGTSAYVDAMHTQSNGALTHATQERSNFFGKILIPINANTTLTLLANYNKLYQNPAIGATLDQINALGSNFAYSNDPTQQNYSRYNNDHITTDIEYADLTSSFGDGWLYDGKVYTYAYYHRDLNGYDVNDQGITGTPSAALVAAGSIPNEVVLTPGGIAQPGVPGENFTNSYRSVGTIQRIQKNFGFGDIKAGAWFDHQSNTRAVSEVSLTNNNAPNYDPLLGLNGQNGNVQSRLQHNQLYTFQPYAQFDYKPVYGLTLTAGVKYAFFKRALKAPVNQGTGIAQGYEHNYTKLLPSFEVSYDFTPQVSAYAQVAEGFLAPNLNALYTTNIQTDSLKPQSTWNYQLGSAYQDQHLALGGDVYLIHFSDFINHTGKGANKVFFNQGGVVYKGIEAEADYAFDCGLSMFANGGYNLVNATGTNAVIAQAPQFTTNAGLIFDKNGIYGSIIDQWTGGEYDGNGQPAGDRNPRHPGMWYDPYNLVNASGGYTFNHLAPHLAQLRVKLNLDNITDQKQIFISPGTTAGSGTPLFYTLPGISAFVSVAVPIAF